MSPAQRRELVRALAAVLVADLRHHPAAVPSDVAPPGTARTVVGPPASPYRARREVNRETGASSLPPAEPPLDGDAE